MTPLAGIGRVVVEWAAVGVPSRRVCDHVGGRDGKGGEDLAEVGAWRDEVEWGGRVDSGRCGGGGSDADGAKDGI